MKPAIRDHEKETQKLQRHQEEQADGDQPNLYWTEKVFAKPLHQRFQHLEKKIFDPDLNQNFQHHFPLKAQRLQQYSYSHYF